MLILVQVYQRYLYSDIKEIIPSTAEEIQTALYSIS